MEKVIIEEASTELLELFDKVSEEARKEKNAVPPINKISYWWTRKPLAAARLIVLSSTLNNIQDVNDLLGLKNGKRVYTYIPRQDFYKKKIGKDPSKIKILDPFGGAGNIIFEAKKLGLDCVVSDYNPVAYLLEKAVLEYPAKYGKLLSEDFVKYAKIVIDKTKEELGKFYDENDLVYFWVWCIKCIHCNQRVPLLNHMWIVNNSKKKIGINFIVTEDKNFKTELIYNMKPEDGKKFTQKHGKVRCISCTNPINYDYMIKDISTRKDREIIAKQIRISKERKYVVASEKDRNLFDKASKYLRSNLNEYNDANLVPDEEMLPAHGKENSLWNYGIKYWRDFYNDRQLLIMIILTKNIPIVCNKIQDKEYQKTLLVYLGFLLCKHIYVNALGADWDNGGEKPNPVLKFRRPAFISNHVEINPFQKVRGSLVNSMQNISKGIDFASLDKHVPVVSLKSVLRLTNDAKKYDLIITDPPYLNDVEYGELSEFFYVWLSRILKKYIEELPKRVKLDEDICESLGRFGDEKLAREFFEKGLKKSFIAMNSVLKDDGILVVFFSHSDVRAWNILLESIRESKFYVVSSYSLHTESESNPVARGKTSFMSSIVVVCRKLSRESIVYFEDIIPIVEDKIKNMLYKIPTQKLLMLPITDLLVMVYGKVLEEATNYTELRSYRKDFKPEFESLISNSRDFILKEIVTKLTGKSINLLGSKISFYILTKVFYQGILSGDDLLKVLRTYGFSKEKLEKDNIVVNEDGHIRLYYLHEYKTEKKPEEIDSKNIHEQLSYLAQLIQENETERINSILSNSNFRLDELKQVIYLLLRTYRLRLNKKEFLLPEEQIELRILETLSDIMKIKSENSLDSFM